MRGSAVTRRVAVGIAFTVLATAAAAQGVALDVSAGRIVYEPLSSNVATNNTSATLRLDLPPGAWLYGNGALPFGSTGLRWGSTGIGGRFVHPISSSRAVNLGADAVADGFVYHDSVLQQSGNGEHLEAIPFVQLPAGAATVEVRGGWRGHRLASAEQVDRHHVLETGVRVSSGGAAQVQADARWVRSDGALYPFYGGQLVYNHAALQAWLRAGRWFSAQLDDVSWGGGAGVRVANRLTLWANVQQDAPDPLYWNLARRGWSIGVTRTFGGGAAPPPLASSSDDPNGVLIRLNAADVEGAAVSIAGDFNGWQPTPMVLEGREWQIRLPLAPGVYHYAFRSERGQWVVPESVPGRRDDGMGGYVAVLVVN